MGVQSPLSIPMSRLKRELNKWIKVIGKQPDTVIYVTRNNTNVSVIVSPSYHERIQSL